jgi:hypothetical protein
MRSAALLGCILVLACTPAGDDDDDGRGGKLDDFRDPAAHVELAFGRYEASGGPGSTASVELHEGALFYATLDDFCFGQRCVMDLVACGGYTFDGKLLRFAIDEYRRADGSPETEPHRMNAAYEVHPVDDDGTLRLIELIEDGRAVERGDEHIVHYTGAAQSELAIVCPEND